MSAYTIHCPQHLNITMLEGFREALLASLETGGECRLNISLVEKVDSTGMQMVVAFRQAMTAKGATVQMKGESEIFSEAAQILGLNPFLE